jgi:hypothetical protein
LFLALAAQIAVLTLPGLQYLFYTVPLDPKTWLITVFTALSIVLTFEIKKHTAGKKFNNA